VKDVGTHIHLQRITRIKDTLQSHLSTALATALKEMKTNPSDPTVKAALVQCLRTYALLDQTTSAEQVIRKEMITPALSNVGIRDTMRGIILHSNYENHFNSRITISFIVDHHSTGIEFSKSRRVWPVKWKPSCSHVQ
jgi:hypothetical protein